MSMSMELHAHPCELLLLNAESMSNGMGNGAVWVVEGLDKSWGTPSANLVEAESIPEVTRLASQTLLESPLDNGSFSMVFYWTKDQLELWSRVDLATGA